MCVIPLFKVARKRKQAARRRFPISFSAGRLYFEQQPSPSCVIRRFPVPFCPQFIFFPTRLSGCQRVRKIVLASQTTFWSPRVQHSFFLLPVPDARNPGQKSCSFAESLEGKCSPALPRVGRRWGQDGLSAKPGIYGDSGTDSSGFRASGNPARLCPEIAPLEKDGGPWNRVNVEAGAARALAAWFGRLFDAVRVL